MLLFAIVREQYWACRREFPDELAVEAERTRLRLQRSSRFLPADARFELIHTGSFSRASPPPPPPETKLTFVGSLIDALGFGSGQLVDTEQDSSTDYIDRVVPLNVPRLSASSNVLSMSAMATLLTALALLLLLRDSGWRKRFFTWLRCK